ncbi:MAG: TIR domain-containing protein [Verrucomicrobia bacterium]|jgi:hypothetical protein|nr:TIR domain-containing protein [Verrucomicrobiota bacterium]MBT7700672.1 TIR domain-containing protein [Verrucomicrobiota bacterium]
MKLISYDVFISSKNMDEAGEPTRDLALAQNIFDALSARGLRVFLSKVSLETSGVAGYKKAIDDALDTASTLVVVGTSAKNLNSRWVRYEWDGFFNDVLSGVKPKGRVFVYVEDLRIPDLPRALRQTQCITHGASSIDHLYQFIVNAAHSPEQGTPAPLTGKKPVTHKQAASTTTKHSIVIEKSALKQLHSHPPSHHRRPKQRPKSHAPAMALLVAAVIVLLVGGISLMNRSQSRKQAARRAAIARIEQEAAEAAKAQQEAAALAAKQKELQAALKGAVEYARTHAEDETGSLARLESVRTAAAGTDVAQQADSAIEQFKAGRQKAIEKVFAGLKARAQKYEASGDPKKAADSVKSYAGPFSRELAGRRAALANEYAKKALRAKAQRPADTVIAETAGRIAADLLDMRFEAVRQKIAEVDRDTALQSREDWTSIKDLTGKTCRMPDLIMAAYKACRGKVTTIQLKQGPAKLQISEVTPERVRAEKLIMANGRVVASSPISFGYTELSVNEKFIRLGNEQSPEKDIMRGLLAWELGRPETAQKYFSRSDSPLGELLATKISEGTEERKTAALAAHDATRESAAAKAFASLLTTAGLSVRGKSVEELTLALQKKQCKSMVVDKLERQLASFQQEFGDTQFTRTHKPVLDVLTLIRPGIPLYVDQAMVDSVVEELKQANPACKVHAGCFQITDEGVDVKFERGLNLVNIQAISALPIVNLTMIDIQVKDMSPLQGMPIRTLKYQGEVPIQNFSVLARAPLEKLHYIGYLRNIDWLRGVGLRSLTLHHRGIYDRVGLNSVSPLAGMPLEYLRISSGGNRPDRGRVPLDNIAALKGAPLKHLDLGRTDITDLGPLEGMPLTFLSITGTKVTDLRPLAGLPLKRLDIRSTKVSDVSPLKDCPLERLDLSGTGVEDVSPLHNIKTLKTLVR